jgi:lipopolysaccharide transport system ATP-binding protein
MEVAPEIAVEVRNVSKRYPASGSQFARFRDLLRSGSSHPERGFWALRDVSFSVRRGEAFGIIGANGSGKSTLLQIVAGILRPTLGSVDVKGRLSALLELGSGFSPEFTGRDNVYLNGSLLGLSHAEMEDRFEEIVHFAQIGDFLDQPTRTYSTGMVLRLAFAVAAHVHPEVLIVDEALAVGDIAFRQRCMRKIHELRAGGTTILFVSHEATDVKALCERCLWLQNGVPQDVGETDSVVAKYLTMTVARETVRLQADSFEDTALHPARHNEIRAAEQDASREGIDLVHGFPQPLHGHRYGDQTAVILGSEALDASHRPLLSLAGTEQIMIRISFQTRERLNLPIAGFLIRNPRGETIFGTNTARENFPLGPVEASEFCTVDFHSAVPLLPPGPYSISVAIAEGTLQSYRVCDYIEHAIEVGGSDTHEPTAQTRGYLRLRCAEIAVHRG